MNNQIMTRNKEGFFDLDKDIEAIKIYEKYVESKFATKLRGVEKIIWLIKNNYYVENLLDSYTDKQVDEIINLVYSHKFQWKTYMSIVKFYNSYALRTDDGKSFLENYQDRIIITALFLSKKNFELAKRLAYEMIRGTYQPATPTFSNSGKKRSGELVSCFLIEVDDSLNSINYIISTSMQLSKIGGGVAINLSKLRAKGAAIKDVAAAASGVVPILKILENVFDYADQLGVRRGAGAVYLNIFHYDLIDFIDCKKINADEKSRIQTLSLGLLVPDKFIQLSKENKNFFVFEPHTVYKKYKQHLPDMDMNVWYEKLAEDDDIIKKEYSARFILNKIARSQFESGYPYIIYIDSANKYNPLKNLGKIKMSNLCTEIFQIQETSKINDYDKEDEIKYDVSCTLGSLNIVNLFESKNFEEIIDVAMRGLTSVVEISSIANAPGIKKANKDLRSVGIGAMNLAGFLIKNNIDYCSEDAKELADVLFAAINYYSILSSCKIAEETKSPFVGFEKSDYASGVYFQKYLQNDYLPKTEKIIEIFKGIILPTKKDWENLSNMVKKHGLYHAYRLAIAPTQTISYLQGATASISPVIDPIEIRMYGESITYFPMPFLKEKGIFAYKSAYQIDQMKMIDLIATIQQHIDQGISTVLFVTNETTTRELVRLYLYAHHKGLKSLYYTRTKNLEVEECLACSA